MKNLSKIKEAYSKFAKGYGKIDYSDIQPIQFTASSNNRVRFNLVLRTFDKRDFFGGASTACRLFLEFLSKSGAEGRIIVIESEIKDTDSLATLEGINIELCRPSEEPNSKMSIVAIPPKYRIDGCLSVRDTDIFIYTLWKTKIVFRDINNFRLKEWGSLIKDIYLIQDYEPGFYSWSTDFLLADSTYKGEDFIAIFNSSSLKDYFKHNNYKFFAEYCFEPTLNKRMKTILENNLEKIHRENVFLLYGRPRIDRNCFALGLNGIKEFIKNNDLERDWKFYSIGVKHKDIKLGKGFTLVSKGKLSIEDYARLLLKSKVGLSLMCSPHPSYPPLEMSSFGVFTVTNDFICKKMTGYNSNIISLDRVDFSTVSNAITIAFEKSKAGNYSVDNTYTSGTSDGISNLIDSIIGNYYKEILDHEDFGY